MVLLRDSEPYPWPYDGELDGRRCALLVAGAQVAWAAASQRSTAVLAVIIEVADALRGAGGQVVAIRHWAPPGGRPRRLPPAAGDHDGELVTGLPPCDLVVSSEGTSGFYTSRLDSELRARGIDRLVLCGFGGEIAVDSTLRAANDRGYECLTLTDGVAPLDEGTGPHALDSITKSGGIFGAIAPSTALLDALLVAPTHTAVTV